MGCLNVRKICLAKFQEYHINPSTPPNKEVSYSVFSINLTSTTSSTTSVSLLHLLAHPQAVSSVSFWEKVMYYL